MNWIRYEYLCTNCDTLIEITTHIEESASPTCPCPESQIILIGKKNANVS